jgi:hypothetical protein
MMLIGAILIGNIVQSDANRCYISGGYSVV